MKKVFIALIIAAIVIFSTITVYYNSEDTHSSIGTGARKPLTGNTHVPKQ